MFLLTRGLPVLLELGLLVYCLVDCLQTPRDAVRVLPRRWWVVMIVLFPVVGGLAWLWAGRPRRNERGPRAPRPPASRAPDDDPDFLARLAREIPHPPTPPEDPSAAGPGAR